jgi:hypothetical protein
LIKTGENVRDGQGNSYQVGQLLGRGLWGKSYIVRRESDESLHVLKLPLGPEDFRGEVPGADAFFAACREAVLEQARLYEQGQFTFLPRLLDRFMLPDGQPALVLPRFPESLERRMADGLPIGSLLDTLLGVAKLLRELAGTAGLHGGLRASNILFNERGELFLTDLATPAVRKHFARLAAVVPGGQPFLPPELTESATPWTAGVDTYALAMILWKGIVAGEAAPPWPRAGLDKAAQVALKDRVVERMKLEDSNPRFHARLAERTAVLLSRALSRETSPSPPYRFPRLDELQARLDEVQQLVRPQVSSVGKIMLDRAAAKPWFTTDEDVAFSTTVGCTAGVEGQEEIGVGIAVFDLDRDVRMKDLALGYSVDRHPSGRYRFAFTVGGLGPGRYRARLAFAIRDSGQPPVTSEAELNVRPAPGWVPRAEPPVASPLPLRPDPVTVTQQAPAAAAAAAPPEAPVRAPTHAVAPPSVGSQVAATPASLPTPGPRVAPPGIRLPVTPAAPPEADRATVGTPPPYTPGPKPAAGGRTDRHGFDDPSITAVPVFGAPNGATALPLPIPPGDRAAALRGADPESTRPSAPPPVLMDAGRADDGEDFPLLPPDEPSVRVPASFASFDVPQPSPVVPVLAPPPPAPPPEPVWRSRDWSQEALPTPGAGRNLDAEDEPAPLDPDDDVGPGPLSRIWHQLRNDPYIAVMAGLGLIIFVLLLVFLVLRK